MITGAVPEQVAAYQLIAGQITARLASSLPGARTGPRR